MTLATLVPSEVMLPLQMYRPSCVVFKGLKVRMDTATLSPGGGVAMVMPSPGTTGVPDAFNEASSHIAMDMLVRPEIASDVTQVRVNSDPATVLPDLLTAAVMGSAGTAGHMVQSLHAWNIGHTHL